jgi:hypothetical protein
MARSKSSTHFWATLRQLNGELQEDVVERQAVDVHGRPERESEDSFPASDAPSSWAGGDPHAPLARRDRVEHLGPVPEVPERRHPGEAVPKTLPRHVGR